MTPLFRFSSVVMLVGSTLLTGCFGYDRILFVTKTNVGLDIENKPPTAEITIARREIAIAPTFQDTIDGEHKTPPLLAAFGRTGGIFTTSLKSHFAGGDAAYWLAKGYPPKGAGAGAAGAGEVSAGAADAEGDGDNINENFSSICLDKEPDSRPPLKKFWHWLTGGSPDENTRAFYFATDTVFGLKVGWDGTGGPYPTNLKLGYNRKELAFPPIFIHPKFEGKCSIKDANGNPVKYTIEDEDGNSVEVIKEGYEVTVPSFFASLDNESSLADRAKEQQLEPAVAKAAAAKATAVEAAAEAAAAKEAQPEAAAEAAAAKAAAAQAKAVEAAEVLAAQQRGLNLEHVQFFATGRAATEWVKRQEVNENAYKEMRGVE